MQSDQKRSNFATEKEIIMNLNTQLSTRNSHAALARFNDIKDNVS